MEANEAAGKKPVNPAGQQQDQGGQEIVPPKVKIDPSRVPQIKGQGGVKLNSNVTIEYAVEQAARVLVSMSEKQDDPVWVESHNSIAAQWMALAQMMMDFQVNTMQMHGDIELKQQQLLHNEEAHQQNLAHNEDTHKQGLTQSQDMHEQNLKHRDVQNKQKLQATADAAKAKAAAANKPAAGAPARKPSSGQ